MARINASALAVARHLAAHPRIARVHYPGLQTHPQHALAARQMSGFSGVVAFEVDGDYARTQAMLAGLQLVTQGVSLGGVIMRTGYLFRPARIHAPAIVEGVKTEIDRQVREASGGQ